MIQPIHPSKEQSWSTKSTYHNCQARAFDKPLQDVESMGAHMEESHVHRGPQLDMIGEASRFLNQAKEVQQRLLAAHPKSTSKCCHLFQL